MESYWIWLLIGVGAITLINTVSRINSKLDEVIRRQNEIEDTILQEVRDYGIDRGTKDDPSGGVTDLN